MRRKRRLRRRPRAGSPSLRRAATPARPIAPIGSGTPQPLLAVNFPASSPWVTGVGGTNFTLTAANTIVPGGEVVWNDGTLRFGQPDSIGAGGGGLSTLFGRPSYQSAAVSGRWRAVPDVSMLADISPGYAIYCTAKPACVGSGAHRVAARRRHERGDAASRRGACVDRRDAPRSQAAAARADQPASVQPRLEPDARRRRCSTTSPTAVTTSAPTSAGSAGRSGAAPPASGMTRRPAGAASTSTAFATQALATQPQIVNIGLKIPRGQRPARAGHIVATVSCTGQCLLGAAADVVIGKSNPFRIQSALDHLAGAGTRSVSIGFTRRELTRVRAALSKHTRVAAYVQAAILDPDGYAERTSNGITLRITS